jgi:sugar lactone lactonase YvrE
MFFDGPLRKRLMLGWVPVFLVLAAVPGMAGKRQKTPGQPIPPELLLEGGRSLKFENTYSSQKDIRGKRGFWTKVIDVVAGEPDFKRMVRPYSVVADSRGRIIVTDPGMSGVHIFDPSQHKYKFIERKDKSKDAMLEPQCVTVDAHDRIYVTDSQVGKIFVFDSNGKYQRAIGSLRGGEGFFKRPTGITIDPETQQIYVTDTLRDKIYVLDNDGQVLRTIGKHGSGTGEFNFPTEVLVRNGVLLVVDAMNFRLQFFDRDGTFRGAIGGVGDSPGAMFRPKGIGLDSEGHIYSVEGLWGEVQVFDREGRLLYTFGRRGTRLGEFQLPTGLFIDRNDRLYVVDSYNQRVQVFQYHGLKTTADGVIP